MTQVNRILKIEWLSAYIEAHDSVFNSRNIQSAFSGTVLVPFQPTRHVALPPPTTPSPPSSPLAPAATPSLFDKEVLPVLLLI